MPHRTPSKLILVSIIAFVPLFGGLVARADLGGGPTHTRGAQPSDATAAKQNVTPQKQVSAPASSVPAGTDVLTPDSVAIIQPYVKRSRPAAGTDSGLVVDAVPGAGATTSNVFDPGTVNLNVATPISHDFILCNNSAAPIEITRIDPSCGCLNVSAGGSSISSATKQPGQHSSKFAPVTLAPGNKLDVTITLDPTKMAPGAFNKAVLVYTDGKDTPSTILTIRCDASTGVTAGPQSLDFGKVSASSTASYPLTISLDKDLLAGRPAPKLVSTSPDVLIGQPMTTGSSSTYRIYLSHTAPLGALYGSISVVDPAEPAKAYATVPVSATITGPLSASVEMLVFGAVPLGKGGAVDAVLSGPAASNILKASSDNPSVLVSISRGVKTTVHAELSPSTSAGPLHATVFVTAASGVRLALPVVADVVAGG